jgi:hypothetical protein
LVSAAVKRCVPLIAELQLCSQNELLCSHHGAEQFAMIMRKACCSEAENPQNAKPRTQSEFYGKLNQNRQKTSRTDSGNARDPAEIEDLYDVI